MGPSLDDPPVRASPPPWGPSTGQPAWLTAAFGALFLGGWVLTRQADDDKVCRAKCGELWDRYTAKVKYRIVPRAY